MCFIFFPSTVYAFSGSVKQDEWVAVILCPRVTKEDNRAAAYYFSSRFVLALHRNDRHVVEPGSTNSARCSSHNNRLQKHFHLIAAV